MFRERETNFLDGCARDVTENDEETSWFPSTG